MFAITSGKGFQITFPSGITLSTQFGGGNYCSNYDMAIFCSNDDMAIGTENQKAILESPDAEIAIWNEDRVWLTNQAYKELFNEEINDVKGNVEIEEWLKILDWCREYRPDETIKGGGNK